MLDGLRRLGHDAVIGGHDEHDHVRHPRTAGPHLRERLVAGGVYKGDLPAVRFDLVGPDVLRDTAGLPGLDVRLPDPVQKARLAVVHVAHHRDYGRLLDQVGGVVVWRDLDRLGLLDRADLDLHPSSSATSSISSVDRVWVSVFISPRPIKTLMIWVGGTPTASPRSLTVAPGSTSTPLLSGTSSSTGARSGSLLGAGAAGAPGAPDSSRSRL